MRWKGLSLAMTGPGGSGYAAATESLRSATKWLLAAAAGVAGLLVAGLQLGSLGKLSFNDWPRLVVAVIGLIIALVAVGAVIWKATALLADEWITLAQLTLKEFDERLKAPGMEQPDTTRAAPANNPPGTDPAGAADQVTPAPPKPVPGGTRGGLPEKFPAGDVRSIYDELDTHREELYGEVAESPEDLYRQLIAVNERIRAPHPSTTPVGRSLTRPVTSPRRPGGIPAYAGPRAPERAAELRAATKTVVEFANYRRTRANFEVLRRTLLIAAPFVVAGLVIFAVAATPPASPSSTNQQRTMAATYTVRPGDTLSGIAEGFVVSLQALEAANPQIANPDLIFPGQVINIPGQIPPSGTTTVSPGPASAIYRPAPSPSPPSTAPTRAFEHSGSHPGERYIIPMPLSMPDSGLSRSKITIVFPCAKPNVRSVISRKTAVHPLLITAAV